MRCRIVLLSGLNQCFMHGCHKRQPGKQCWEAIYQCRIRIPPVHEIDEEEKAGQDKDQTSGEWLQPSQEVTKNSHNAKWQQVNKSIAVSSHYVWSAFSKKKTEVESTNNPPADPGKPLESLLHHPGF